MALQLSSFAQELLPWYLEDCFKCKVVSMPQRELATLRSCEAAAAIRGPHGCVYRASVLQMHFPHGEARRSQATFIAPCNIQHCSLPPSTAVKLSLGLARGIYCLA